MSNAAHSDRPEKLDPTSRVLHELVAERAVAHPDAVALVDAGRQVSYAELDVAANRLAHVLLADGVRPGEVVGVLVDRDARLVVAVLAVLKAGAAYSLLDPRFPAERVAALLSAADARLLLTDPAHAEAAHAAAPPTTRILDIHADVSGCPGTAPSVAVDPAEAACVMFTSGSTGRPKGVLTPHRAVVASLHGQDFVAGAGRAWLQCSPVSWDAFALELFGPLLAGGSCVLHPGHDIDPAVIAALVAAYRVDTLHASASLLNHLVDTHPDTFSGLRQVLTGGEAASAAHLGRLLTAQPRLVVVNGYSPVENTIFALTHRVTADECTQTGRPIPVGRPLPGKGVLVLDERLRPLPVGAVGEVYMTGAGLAHGYLGQPALTAQRFVANPYGPPGTRLYRTGDLARWGSDGALTLTGRTDEQVKIRGFRIEPAEVTAALTTHTAVRTGAVVVRTDGAGETSLVAYVVPEPGATLTTAALREHAVARLPQHLRPSAYVLLDALPLTATGKLDRAALPAPTREEPNGDGAPRTAREEILCALFAEVLRLPADRVGRDDDFFHLGGHSLLAARLAARARVALGAELGIGELFDSPTPASLARLLQGRAPARPALVATSRPDRVPLSAAQARMWFLGELDGWTDAYHVVRTIGLDAPADPAALTAAIHDVVDRHESLRTVIRVEDAQPWQHVLPPADHRPGLVVDLPADDASELATRPFDLATDPPIRAGLVPATDGAGVGRLMLVLHHVAADGWSMPVLLDDLATAYQARLDGRAPDWAPLPVQYADYTLWQADLLGDASDPASLAATQLTHWTEALAGAPATLDLPTDRVPGATATFRADLVAVRLPRKVLADLSALAAARGATLFMVIHAALAALLTRLGAGEDIVIGTPVAGRGDAALDELVGFFVNTLVLRTDTSGDPAFAELLARVRAVDLAAFDHADLPFDHLVERLNPARSLSRHPLFQVMLTVQTEPEPTLHLGPVFGTVEPVPNPTAKFDLNVGLIADGDGLHGSLEYDTDVFDRVTVQRFAARLGRLLEAVAADVERPIGDIDLLEPDELTAVSTGWAGATTGVPTGCVHERFAAQAAATPHATAVIGAGESLSYARLLTRANRLAHRLVAAGVRPGDVVAVHVDRDVHLATAVLGALTAGAAYTMLDPTFPAERLATIVGLSSARLVVGDPVPGRSGLCVLHPAPGPTDDAAGDAEPPAVLVTGADAACVMFTSGSTGTPKGVLTPHRALLATLVGQTYAGFGPGEVWLQTAPVSWDAFATQLLGPLLHGGACALYPGHHLDPAGIARLVIDRQVTVLDASASLFNYLLDEHPEVFAAVRRAMTGGEPASMPHVARALRSHPHVALVNGYGPAESTGFTTCHDITAADETAPSVPVGRPLPGKRCHVLDERLRPVPVGVVGEVYVSGHGLAYGYLGQPAQTASRFVANPYGPPGTCFYRTGDLARWRSDGTLALVGRADEQVKIRGYRIEPGEVSATIATHPAVRQCAVMARSDTAIARPDGASEMALVAYVVPEPGTTPTTAALREHAMARLPQHLRPSVYVLLDAFPLTRTGKLDRAALPGPMVTVRTGTADTAPRTREETALCELFGEVLGVTEVGRDDGFFDLGGHSLLAARLLARIRVELGCSLGMRAVLEAQTPAALARRLGERETGDALSVVLPLRKHGRAPALFCLHPATGIGWLYSGLLRHLSRPIYALQARGLTEPARRPASLVEMAKDYLAEIRVVQPTGPYHLLGWSFGAHVAHALACMLQAEGERVDQLVMLDGYPTPVVEPVPYGPRAPQMLSWLLDSLGYPVGAAAPTWEQFCADIGGGDGPLAALGADQLANLAHVFADSLTLRQGEPLGIFSGDVLFFRAVQHGPSGPPSPAAWQPWVDGAIEVHDVDCTHGRMTQPGPIDHIGRLLAKQVPTDDAAEGPA
ncbi:MAG: amino acid adenylation domain-containing protein [Frankiaceae bacterium]